MKKGNDGGLRMGTVLCFAAGVMVILSLVNLHRTQALLHRLEQGHKDCATLSLPSSSSAWAQRGKQSRRPRADAIATRDNNQNKNGVANAKVDAAVVDRPVYFLNKNHLNMPHDAFSATFWQSKERFLKVNLDRVQSVEGAVFEQLRRRDESGQVVEKLLHQTRMTTDWLDFSVEHLSKWWRTLDYDCGPSPIAYHALVQKLLAMMQRIPLVDNASNTAMPQTVAVIAYMPYYSELKPTWGQVLTVVNVAATVASLVRHGVGRVVVVSEEDTTTITTANHNSQALVQAAFHLINLRHDNTAFQDWQQTIPRLIQHAEQTLATQARSEMQIDATTAASANVNVTYSWIVEGTNRTNYMTLVPRAALDHLQKALRGESAAPDLWLGSGKSPDDYRYVYLTEPDTILNMRSSAMKSIQYEMDQGNFLVPHRMQPAPHETDVAGYKDNRNWIPNFGIMSNITTLHSDRGDACCDDGIRRPKDDFPKCNSNWWACGYTQDQLSAEQRVAKHLRVHPYALVRLPDVGTNLVLHAATNHGRRCIPQRQTVCAPP